MILEKILAQKKRQLEAEMERQPLATLVREVERLHNRPTRDFAAAIRHRRHALAIIAEVKQSSPSRGTIRPSFDPTTIAQSYHDAQVDAVSVLTETEFFGGSDRYLPLVKDQVHVPVLRKDFIIHPYQVFQSVLLGADCILLIAAALGSELPSFCTLAKQLQLQCLVETHTTADVDLALRAGGNLIGINNRNLRTFATDLSVTASLAKFIPADRLTISESGIHNRKDMEFLESIGIDGVLIGESLMKAPSITEKIQQLRGENGHGES